MYKIKGSRSENILVHIDGGGGGATAMISLCSIKNMSKKILLYTCYYYYVIVAHNIYCETAREKTKWSRKSFAKLGG